MTTSRSSPDTSQPTCSRRPITVEMVIQEINRYADSEFRYDYKSDEVAIDAMVRDMGRMEEAKRRYVGGKG